MTFPADGDYLSFLEADPPVPAFSCPAAIRYEQDSRESLTVTDHAGGFATRLSGPEVIDGQRLYDPNAGRCRSLRRIVGRRAPSSAT